MSHIDKVLDYAVLHRLRYLQVRTHCLGLITDHEVLDLYTRRGDRIALFGAQDRTADDRGEHMLREIGACA